MSFKKWIYSLFLVLALGAVGCSEEAPAEEGGGSSGTSVLQPSKADCGDSSCL